METIEKAKALFQSNNLVTFKDLKKIVSLDAITQQCRLTEILKNKPFWIWSVKEHKQEDTRTNGDCYLIISYRGETVQISLSMIMKK